MKLSHFIDDILILGGCGLICVGTYLICPVATWFVAGALCIALGVAIGLGGSKP